MTATTPPANAPTSLPAGSVTAWALRRALIGLLILTITIGGSAWLLHASIEPLAESQDVVSTGEKG